MTLYDVRTGGSASNHAELEPPKKGGPEQYNAWAHFAASLVGKADCFGSILDGNAKRGFHPGLDYKLAHAEGAQQPAAHQKQDPNEQLRAACTLQAMQNLYHPNGQAAGNEAERRMWEGLETGKGMRGHGR